MEQKLYDLLTNLVRLAIILASIVIARKPKKRKPTRRIPHSNAENAENARKTVKA